jgi:hypothetical protein
MAKPFLPHPAHKGYKKHIAMVVFDLWGGAMFGKGNCFHSPSGRRMLLTRYGLI